MNGLEKNLQKIATLMSTNKHINKMEKRQGELPTLLKKWLGEKIINELYTVEFGKQVVEVGWKRKGRELGFVL